MRKKLPTTLISTIILVGLAFCNGTNFCTAQIETNANITSPSVPESKTQSGFNDLEIGIIIGMVAIIVIFIALISLVLLKSHKRSIAISY